MNSTNDLHESTEPHESHAASSAARPIRPDAQGRRRRFDLARWLEVGRNLGSQMEEQVQKRPFAILGATVGLGFAAGSLFGSRLGQLLLAGGIGYAIRNAGGGETGDRIRAGLEKLAHERDVD